MVMLLSRKRLSLATVLAFLLAICLFCCRPTHETVAAQDGVLLPIVMYHGLHPDTKKQGDYVISPTLFEDDLRFLTQNGYTTVTIEQLIAYTKGGTLPEKPVLLTFDDGYLNNHLYGTPLLQTYGCQAVLSPIVSETVRYSALNDRSPAYAQVTWNDLRTMRDTGCWDIQNHTYALHTYTDRNGSSRLPFESLEAYATVLQADIGQAQTLLQREVNITPRAFAYPFGAIGKGEREILQDMGFAVTLTCTEQHNTVTREAECLLDMGRFRRRNRMSAREFFTHVVKLP